MDAATMSRRPNLSKPTPLPPTRSSRHLLPSIAQPLHRLLAHTGVTQLFGFSGAQAR
ncbi:conserved hypothetical protein [Xanthomonas campestris pv. campestris str. 8004]|uniref:Uncharacterized protein n=2 Tax=Xanthomonas campestris pv. campestris TaxID=340 RepID=Q8PEB7_XANCP|nr:conserved hypothetical protein [Xanthomonas campestris pv. campestris str. ATCC 33913]AAY47156.1 conserved hypothetical protein [Xanthomonas campestris pv. campestris str. 8004]QCX66281.1 hypothetical protein DFG55_07290 [Xanthomonas campestris pv. campestris]QCX69399.1 hypothetical protein DFG54_00075 [Xanthomonas campestris pv. campestris]